MRFLNGFNLIGLILFFISLGGLASGNRLLTEPGQPVNPYAWLLYLGASVIMIVNGYVSIRNARQSETSDKSGKTEASDKQTAETETTDAGTVSDSANVQS
jgi:hypothetical protein